MSTPTLAELARMFDHSLLQPNLTDADLERGCLLARATLEDLRLMRERSPAWVQVKAAGGVRTFERLLEVRQIGVTRVGATATKQILDEAKAKLGGWRGGVNHKGTKNTKKAENEF